LRAYKSLATPFRIDIVEEVAKEQNPFMGHSPHRNQLIVNFNLFCKITAFYYLLKAICKLISERR